MSLEIEKLNLPGVADERPLVIAGPCCAVSEVQVMATAMQLWSIGI